MGLPLDHSFSDSEEIREGYDGETDGIDLLGEQIVIKDADVTHVFATSRVNEVTVRPSRSERLRMGLTEHRPSSGVRLRQLVYR